MQFSSALHNIFELMVLVLLLTTLTFWFILTAVFGVVLSKIVQQVQICSSYKFVCLVLTSMPHFSFQIKSILFIKPEITIKVPQWALQSVLRALFLSSKTFHHEKKPFSSFSLKMEETAILLGRKLCLRNGEEICTDWLTNRPTM